jgi:hypothetical protein
MAFKWKHGGKTDENPAIMLCFHAGCTGPNPEPVTPLKIVDKLWAFSDL